VKDYQASIEKLRRDAAEAALIRDLTTDRTKREIFADCTNIAKRPPRRGWRRLEVIGVADLMLVFT
jgi:hypothetical protein